MDDSNHISRKRTCEEGINEPPQKRHKKDEKQNVMEAAILECMICHSGIEREGFTLTSCECKTVYHTSCFEKWINTCRTCPTCRYRYKLKPPPKNRRSKVINISSVSRINNDILRSNMNGISNTQSLVFAVNYNILRIMSGLGGLSFTN